MQSEAVSASNAALEFYNRNEHPMEWAAAQNNLAIAIAIAIEDQGNRTDGEQGTDLLAQAVTAFNAALELRTREGFPVQWAMTQQNIAIAEQARAGHDTCTNPRPHLTAALEAVENALTIFDPVHMSYNHTKATELRDDIQVKLDLLSPE